MAVMVPYIGGAGARNLMARAMSTTGTRLYGRNMVNIYAQQQLQPIIPMRPILKGLADDGSCCHGCSTHIPYQAAKRMNLGALGTSYDAPIGAGAGQGAETGASQGAMVGTYFGPLGTAIGAVAGAIGGAIAGSINKKDPEQYNFDQAVALWQANRLAVLNIGNKYLVLAGLFDLNLKNPHIPIYNKYGHMGEQRFVTDFANLLYQAGNSGQITAADTPGSIMTRIVQPWIDSWGFGPMVDPHSDLINLIMQGMIAEYVSGQQGAWLSRTGQNPFGSAIQPFPLQKILAAAAAPVPTAAPVPVPLPATTQAIVSVTAAPSCTAPLVWNGSQCVQQAPTTVAPAPVAAALPVAMVAASPPAGFNQVGTDTAGNPVFQSSAGMLYEWNGSAMQLFAGSLSSGQSAAAQIQAAIQQALAQGQSAAQAAQSAIAQAQAQGVPITPAQQPALQQQAAATAAAPTVTASVSAGSNNTLWLLAGGGALLLLLMGRKHHD